jgi:hypothetical protein
MEAASSEAGEREFRPRRPGPFFPWVKRMSLLELAVFAGLLVVWLLPGLERATFFFGLTHGIGFIVLCLMIWIAVLRREAPFWLLAAARSGSSSSSVASGRRPERRADRGHGGAGPREAGGPRGPHHRQRVGSQGGMPTRSPPEAGLTGSELREACAPSS